MNCSVRKVRRGDEETLAFIQTESWKAAFKDIISPETLKKCTDKETSKAMYREIIEKISVAAIFFRSAQSLTV